MKKKAIKIILTIPLILINLVNILFIIYKLGETKYLNRVTQILGNYFLGFHLIPLFIALIFFCAFYFYKKKSISFFIYSIAMLLLIFLTSINLSLFPEIHENFKKSRWGFQKKKTSYLKEAISFSRAPVSGDILAYIYLNNDLANKTISIPPSSPLDKDFFFQGLIASPVIKRKQYKYVLTDRDFRIVENLKSKKFKASRHVREYIDSYLLIHDPSQSNIFTLFYHHSKIIFIPQKLAQHIFPHFYD